MVCIVYINVFSLFGDIVSGVGVFEYLDVGRYV